MSREVKKLLVRMEELLELQRQAMENGDSDALQKYLHEYLEFVTLHQNTLNVSDEMIANLRAKCEKSDKLRAQVKKLSGELEKAKKIYHDSLLDIPPQGKDRTEH
ncbi:MAG TPA: hypothetical protein PKY59_26480 [Pyrinomonadaceae bacterium]|nr:hypothetical protein [Pyrinomonadaceae bacterium]